MKNRLLTLRSTLLILICTVSLASCGGSSKDATVFKISFKNISKTPTFTAQNGAGVVVAYSSLLGVVHTGKSPIYTLNAKAPKGLEELAEAGNPSEYLQDITVAENVEVVGVANQTATDSSGLLAPNDTFTLLLSAQDPADSLSLAVSFLQANDIIVSTPENGIPLFKADGTPFSGDISSQFAYYDVGTEANEPPGLGVNQVLRQGTAPAGQVSAGTAENGVIKSLNDGFSYPPVSSTLQVTISVFDQVNLPPRSPSPSPEATTSASPTRSASPTPSASKSPSSSPSPSASRLP